MHHLARLVAPLLFVVGSPAQAPDAHGHSHSHGDHDTNVRVLRLADVLALPQNHHTFHRRSARNGSTSAGSGTGRLRFEVLMRSNLLPDVVREENPQSADGRSILECAHGGFAYDHREGRGEVYWFLQGAGILRVRSDRSGVDLLETDPRMKRLNMHNATFFVQVRTPEPGTEPGQEPSETGEPRIAWPAEGAGQVFLTDTEGAVLEVIGRPEAEQYAGETPYAPTDTAYLDGLLWVADGYGSRFVMAYDLERHRWSDRIFGGRSEEPEPSKFGTNHGLTIHGGLLHVSGRTFARIHQYRPDTSFVGMFPLPEGSRPCDFEFFVLDERLYGVAGSLDAASGSGDRGAAIYIVDMATLEIVSVVKPCDELGLERFVHLHNVFPVVDGGRVALFCQAWNPGDFAVLRQLPH